MKGLNDPEQTVAKSKSANAEKPATGRSAAGANVATGEDRHQGDMDGADRDRADKERAVLQDPYAVLKKLADEAERRAVGKVQTSVGDIGSRGRDNGDLNRDPFDPAYWQIPGVRPVQAEIADQTRSPPAAQRSTDPAGPRRDGEVRAGDTRPPEVAKPTAPARQKADEQLEAEIRKVITAAIGAQHAPNVNVRATANGLGSDLTDDIDYSMFPVGSAVTDARFVRAMAEIARLLQSRPGEVTLRGHTDARPFRSENYDNWRLSSARAQMALYMLVRGGLDEKRVRKIEGTADRELKNAADPNAAENRRIEILLRSTAP